MQILDVGCGSGEFLVEASKKGWSAVGTEIGGAPPAGLTVYRDLRDVKERFGTDSFDAVTLWHSLEHFRDPAELLTAIRDLIKDDGRLFIAVPDSGGLQARVFGKHWFHLDVPRHLYHFDPVSLQKLLASNGFELSRSWHQEFEYDLLGWSQSLLNKIFRRPNVFFQKLTGRAANAGTPESIVHTILGLLFSALAVPLVFLGTSLRKGGTIVVLASKKTS